MVAHRYAGFAGIVVASSATTPTPTAGFTSPFNLQTCGALVASATYRSLANMNAVACAQDVPEFVPGGGGTGQSGLTRLGKVPISSATISRVLASTACRLWYGNLAMSIVNTSPPCTYTDVLAGQTVATNRYTTSMAAYITLVNDRAIQNAANSTQETTDAPPTIMFPPGVGNTAATFGITLASVLIAVLAALA
ncbi:hypothetical protein H257_12405 [Aphanomyces astaci]|uniref:Uncharacterized protein n=1 Tax=Aphanomyces astaci TaxID=112090 RepID=W4FYW7_APHAT|nr:hypothetical protein H257_12405 [Aphanomyces astaci]ETV72657.1 hypothetical protein H257_12405 [Aphanomyces astaci]|eukprot:XP_009837885.1 hypothetical protein H257_12405 [Aphanomyces astaci]